MRSASITIAFAIACGPNVRTDAPSNETGSTSTDTLTSVDPIETSSSTSDPGSKPTRDWVAARGGDLDHLFAVTARVLHRCYGEPAHHR
jgi:hypothetical protein